MSAEFWVQASAIGTLAYAGITLIYLIIVSRQTIDTRKHIQAQFLFELEKEFNQYRHIFGSIEKNADNNDEKFEAQVEKYLDFFERVYTLVDIKVIDMALVKRAFGNDFKILMENATAKKMMEKDKVKYEELPLLKRMLFKKRR